MLGEKAHRQRVPDHRVRRCCYWTLSSKSLTSIGKNVIQFFLNVVDIELLTVITVASVQPIDAVVCLHLFRVHIAESFIVVAQGTAYVIADVGIDSLSVEED